MTNVDASYAVLGRAGIVATSEWVEITQEMIDKFADATGDHQYIHVDTEAAARGPFGGTIAHGFLTLSLFARLAHSAPGVFPPGAEGVDWTGINYGGNRVRFLAPVRSSTRVRGQFKVIDVSERGSNLFQQTTEFIVEIEGQSKPALIAEWIVQFHFLSGR